MGYVAMRRIGKNVAAGDILPDAETWRSFQGLARMGWITHVDDGEENVFSEMVKAGKANKLAVSPHMSKKQVAKSLLQGSKRPKKTKKAAAAPKPSVEAKPEAPTPEPEAAPANSLLEKSRTELLVMCQNKGVTGASQMRRDQMIAALATAGE